MAGSKAFPPQEPDSGLFAPRLGGPKPVNPRYFKSETWARHVKHELGQQQYAKFVKDMAERIWAQASTADEIRAFANLLGDEEEWNLLSVGINVLKKMGAYDCKGPCASQHFQSCLLWQQVNKIIAARQEQIANKFSRAERESVPYDDRIHLRQVDVVTRALFGPLAGSPHSEHTERIKRSFEACGKAVASSLNTPVDQVTFVTPNSAAMIPIREAPYIVTASKPTHIQDVVPKNPSRWPECYRRDRSCLTSENAFRRQVELNNELPRRPTPPDIPDRLELFDATGLRSLMAYANQKTPPPLPGALKNDDRPINPSSRKASTTSRNSSLQAQCSSTSYEQHDSSLPNTQPPTTISKSQQGPLPQSSLQGSGVPQSLQQEAKSSGSRSSRTRARSLRVVAIPSIAEPVKKKPQSSCSDSLLRLPQTKRNAHDIDMDKINDCPPNDLLVEGGGAKTGNHKEEEHISKQRTTLERKKSTAAR